MWLNAFQLGTHPPGLGHILFDSTIQSIPSDPEKTKLCLDFPDPVSQSRLADLHPRVPFRMKETVIYSKSDINIPTRFLKWWMNLPTKYSVDQSSQKKHKKHRTFPRHSTSRRDLHQIPGDFFRKPHLLAAAMPLAIRAVGTADLAWSLMPGSVPLGHWASAQC